MKSELAAARDRRSALGENKAEKKKRRVKKVKKRVKKSTSQNANSSSTNQSSAMSRISSTSANNNNQEDGNRSEYEFISESEFASNSDFDEDDFVNAEESSYCINNNEEDQIESDGYEGAEVELECPDAFIISREFRPSSGGSKCAEINSDYSQFDYSSLSDTFYYENFPSRSGKTSVSYKQDSTVNDELDERSIQFGKGDARRSDPNHDDDEDIQAELNDCIKLLNDI